MMFKRNKPMVDVPDPNLGGIIASGVADEKLYRNKVENDRAEKVKQAMQEERAQKVEGHAAAKATKMAKKAQARAEKIRNPGQRNEVEESYDVEDEQETPKSSRFKGPLLGLVGIAATAFVATKMLPNPDAQNSENRATLAANSLYLTQYGASRDEKASLNQAFKANHDICVVEGDALPFKEVSRKGYMTKAEAQEKGPYFVAVQNCDQILAPQR